jgi:tetratricopeptide (TPR) repeat protein/2-polyprenyl-3-methyl-5-hydroxy-6-metoxy-1,4-benzoquinol methylase
LNRKQRRAFGKTTPAAAQSRAGAQELFAAAVQCHREGRLGEAAGLYQRALAFDPCHADSLHRLGVIAHQEGRHVQAVDLLQAAIAQNAGAASYHSHLGLALAALDRLEEAEISCRTATNLAPNLPDLHNNLGAILMRLGRREDAAAAFRAAIACDPRLPEPHNNLGHVLLELGRPREAEGCYRRLLSLVPSLAEGHASLACALMAQNDMQGALAAILQALALEETAERRRIFVQCVKHMRFADEAAGVRPLLLRALKEGWDRPDDLARVSADLICHDPAIARWTHANAHPEIGEEEEILTALAGDALLKTLLCLTPNQDMALERLLILARRLLLKTAIHAADGDGRLDFSCALARQCFINEYVFAQSGEELSLAEGLRDRLSQALEQGGAVPASWVAALAAYFPLSSVPHDSGLLDRDWPVPIEALLTQQLREPEEERISRSTIPQLTSIRDDISRAVRTQYEENPYPRWVEAGSAAAPEGLADHLRRSFPFASIAQVGEPEILVAGCGTGRNAIETTQRFKGARTLAIDLSVNSLGYAARKTPKNLAIGYAQADLLELGSIGRRFDLIEAVGVLHHLADPFAGWRVLVSLLKPRGLMMMGLYSANARRNLPDRSVLPDQPTAHAIRQLRQGLIERHPDLSLHPDFFTVSSCRDLLFHVQEHHLSLAAISDFLTAHDLKLLGFSIDEIVLAAYRQRFPDDPGATDLGHWQAMEEENPDIFSGMYQFWLQKVS